VEGGVLALAGVRVELLDSRFEAVRVDAEFGYELTKLPLPHPAGEVVLGEDLAGDGIDLSEVLIDDLLGGEVRVIEADR
jgi:hypothetical protein